MIFKLGTIICIEWAEVFNDMENEWLLLELIILCLGFD